MTSKGWRLYERKTMNGYQSEFAVVSPDDRVRFYRVVTAVSFLPTVQHYPGVGTDLSGQTLKTLLEFDGWKKSARRVEQALLERGII